MSEDIVSRTESGGSAAARGFNYQHRVTAWFAVRLLAGSSASGVRGLYQGPVLEVACETGDPVDDCRVRLADGVLVLQAKRSIDLETSRDRDLGQTAGQFVRQHLMAGHSADRLVLVTTSSSSRTVVRHLKEALDRYRKLPEPPVPLCRPRTQNAAITTFLGHVKGEWELHSQQAAEPTEEQLRTFLKCCWVWILDVEEGEAEERMAMDVLRSSVLSDPGQADLAWDTLLERSAQAAASKTGFDRHVLESVLTDHGIELISRQRGASPLPARRQEASYHVDVRQHWGPRARGVSSGGEQGWRFRGRTKALGKLVDWLGGPVPGPRVLVITGKPGAGKSAVLSRIVTTADRRIRASMPPDEEVLAGEGSVRCAVHATGKTALEVASEIAAAASARLPADPGDLALVVQEALEAEAPSAGAASRRFGVVIDALDEAASPSQARAIIDSIVLLVETCSGAGVRVVMATREKDDDGDLLARFGRACEVIDLDKQEYFREEDLAAYALACLRLARGEQLSGPYADEAAARPLAEAIARAAGKNFLIAGLIARTHGIHDTEPADPAELGPVTSVGVALEGYLKRLTGACGLSAARIFTALAFAEAPGLTARLWQLAIEALPPAKVADDWPVTAPAEQLAAFAQSAAANFLVEAGEEATGPNSPGGRSYRLFHQALSDALLESRKQFRANDERALTDAFMAYGRKTGWAKAPRYLLRSLPRHALAAGKIDDLLTGTDADAYLLYADLSRVQPPASRATSDQGRQRARLLRLTPRAVLTADAPNRAAMFGVTAVVEGIRDDTYQRPLFRPPYRAAWSAAPGSVEHLVLHGDRDSAGNSAICAYTAADGTARLATSGGGHGGGGPVQIWDPATGTQIRTLTEHDHVRAICAYTAADGTARLAINNGGRVQIWDPATGIRLRTLSEGYGSYGRQSAICAYTAADGTVRLAVSAGGDYDDNDDYDDENPVENGTVQIWNPATGDRLLTMTTDKASVSAICAFTIADGTARLATVSEDETHDTVDHGTVLIWDPATGSLIHTLTADFQVNAICAYTTGTGPRLATSNFGRTIQLWAPDTGTRLSTLGDDPDDLDYNEALCAYTAADGTIRLAAVTDRGIIQIWNPAAEKKISSFAGNRSFTAICAFTADGTSHLATTSNYGPARVWDPASIPQTDTPAAHNAKIEGIHAFTSGDKVRLATQGNDHMIRLWEPTSGTPIRILSYGSAICAYNAADGTAYLASGDHEGRVHICDPAAGTQLRILTPHDLKGREEWVKTLCGYTADGTTYLAVGDYSGAIRIWDPATETQLSTLLTGKGHSITAICPYTAADGTTHLATADFSGAIRIWDPATATEIHTLTSRDGGDVLCAYTAADGTTYLATGDHHGAIRIWDPATETQLSTLLTGKDDWITGICSGTAPDGSPFLAATCYGRFVQIWDPAKERRLLVIPTRDIPWSVAYADGLLVVGTETGLLAIRIDPECLESVA